MSFVFERTVPAQIVDMATISSFGLFGAATIQTESTIILNFLLDPKNIHFFTKTSSNRSPSATG